MRKIVRNWLYHEIEGFTVGKVLTTFGLGIVLGAGLVIALVVALVLTLK